jgi:hypothetical protein
MSEFHCGNSIHAFSVLWTSSLPPLYSHLPHSFSNSIWWVSLCYLHVYVYTCVHIHKYSKLLFSSPLSILSFSHPSPSPFTFISHCYHHHHFRPKFHKWARACNIQSRHSRTWATLRSILLRLFWRWGLGNNLPGLALNQDPPDLSLPRSLGLQVW